MHNQVRTNRDMYVIKIGLHKVDYEIKPPICNNIIEENNSICTYGTLDNRLMYLYKRIFYLT